MSSKALGTFEHAIKDADEQAPTGPLMLALIVEDECSVILPVNPRTASRGVNTDV
jgi:hypothetical protein